MDDMADPPNDGVSYRDPPPSQADIESAPTYGIPHAHCGRDDCGMHEEHRSTVYVQEKSPLSNSPSFFANYQVPSQELELPYSEADGSFIGGVHEPDYYKYDEDFMTLFAQTHPNQILDSEGNWLGDEFGLVGTGNASRVANAPAMEAGWNADAGTIAGAGLDTESGAQRMDHRPQMNQENPNRLANHVDPLKNVVTADGRDAGSVASSRAAFSTNAPTMGANPIADAKLKANIAALERGLDLNDTAESGPPAGDGLYYEEGPFPNDPAWLHDLAAMERTFPDENNIVRLTDMSVLEKDAPFTGHIHPAVSNSSVQNSGNVIQDLDIVMVDLTTPDEPEPEPEPQPEPDPDLDFDFGEFLNRSSDEEGQAESVDGSVARSDNMISAQDLVPLSLGVLPRVSLTNAAPFPSPADPEFHGNVSTVAEDIEMDLVAQQDHASTSEQASGQEQTNLPTGVPPSSPQSPGDLRKAPLVHSDNEEADAMSRNYKTFEQEFSGIGSDDFSANHGNGQQEFASIGNNVEAAGSDVGSNGMEPPNKGLMLLAHIAEASASGTSIQAPSHQVAQLPANGPGHMPQVPIGPLHLSPENLSPAEVDDPKELSEIEGHGTSLENPKAVSRDKDSIDVDGEKLQHLDELQQPGLPKDNAGPSIAPDFGSGSANVPPSGALPTANVEAATLMKFELDHKLQDTTSIPASSLHAVVQEKTVTHDEKNTHAFSPDDPSGSSPKRHKNNAGVKSKSSEVKAAVVMQDMDSGRDAEQMDTGETQAIVGIGKEKLGGLEQADELDKGNLEEVIGMAGENLREMDKESTAAASEGSSKVSFTTPPSPSILAGIEAFAKGQGHGQNAGRASATPPFASQQATPQSQESIVRSTRDASPTSPLGTSGALLSSPTTWATVDAINSNSLKQEATEDAPSSPTPLGNGRSDPVTTSRQSSSALSSPQEELSTPSPIKASRSKPIATAKTSPKLTRSKAKAKASSLQSSSKPKAKTETHTTAATRSSARLSNTGRRKSESEGKSKATKGGAAKDQKLPKNSGQALPHLPSSTMRETRRASLARQEQEEELERSKNIGMRLRSRDTL